MLISNLALAASKDSFVLVMSDIVENSPLKLPHSKTHHLQQQQVSPCSVDFPYFACPASLMVRQRRQLYPRTPQCHKKRDPKRESLPKSSCSAHNDIITCVQSKCSLDLEKACPFTQLMLNKCANVICCPISCWRWSTCQLDEMRIINMHDSTDFRCRVTTIKGMYVGTDGYLEWK